MGYTKYKTCTDVLAALVAAAECPFESGKVKAVALLSKDADIVAFVDDTAPPALIADAAEWDSDNGIVAILKDVRGGVPEITDNTYTDLKEVVHVVDQTYLQTIQAENVDGNLDFFNQIKKGKGKYGIGLIYEDNKVWFPLNSDNAGAVIPVSIISKPIGTGNDANSSRRMQVTFSWRSKDFPYSFEVPADLAP